MQFFPWAVSQHRNQWKNQNWLGFHHHSDCYTSQANATAFLLALPTVIWPWSITDPSVPYIRIHGVTLNIPVMKGVLDKCELIFALGGDRHLGEILPSGLSQENRMQLFHARNG